MSKVKSEVRLPWELPLFGLAVGAAGGFAAYRGATVAERSVPEVGDLLPWRLAIALVSVIAVSALLKAVVAYSANPNDRKSVALASGILSPYFTVAAASLSLGVATGWVVLVLDKQTDDGPAYALLSGVGVVVVAGFVLLGVASSRLEPALQRYHRRLNPQPPSPVVECKFLESTEGVPADAEVDLTSS